MEYLRCILVLTLLGVISHTESLSLKGNTSFPCGTMETITCKVDSASAIPATLTWKKDTLTFTECDDGGSKITCTQSVKQGKYITADYTKKEYYITFNTSKLTDSGVWECSDVSSSSQLPIVVTPSPVAGNLTQPSTDGRLNVTSPCFASSTSIDLDWYCKDSSSNEHKLTQIQAATNSVVSCAVDDCTGAGYIRHTVEATFEQSPSCTIPVIAYLKAGSFSSSIELPGACIKGPIACTAEPTTTIPTSTTTTTTATSATTDVQTTASTPTTATSTVTLPTTSAPTTATSTVIAPTTATSIATAPTTSTPTTATLTVTAPTTATSTIIAPSTSAPTTATQVGYIVGGCIGGAIVVALLIVIPLCLLRGPMCKGWRSKKLYETSKDPGAKHSSARHHRHGGNSHTRKQFERPQKSHTPDQSFPNHYNKHAYVGPAGRSSGHHVNVSKPPSYAFYDPYSGEYVRTAGQRGGHPIGQRYAPYPQSQHRGRMQQTWYQPYTPGRPRLNDNSGNWDFYY